MAYPSRVCSQICCVAQTSTHTTQIPLSVRFPTPSQRSHCLRSRPATPTAVFATAPAPEAANDSAIAASARRSSAEGSVADDALSAACAERSKASRPSAIGPSSSYVLWKTTDSSSDVPRPISQLSLRHPAKPLAARRPKVPSPLATRLPSSLLKTSIFLERK